jgi:hypothetical protein
MIKNRMREFLLGSLLEWGAIQNQVALCCVKWLYINVQNNKAPLRALHVLNGTWRLSKFFRKGSVPP